MSGIRTLLLCGAALAGLASPVWAADAAGDSVLVDELLVTAASLEETLPLELSKYGSDIEIVTRETIRNAGYVDLSQALQMQVPGVHLAPRNGPFSYVDLSLQGSRTGDVLWLVDGVRINNRLYTSTSPADTLPASMIERIEVLKGGQGLFYGTQAAAGVINVVTRPFAETPEGSLTVGGHTNKGVHADAYFSAPLGAHRFALYASKDEAEGYRTFDVFQPSATARRRGYDVVSVGAKYGYDLTDDLSLTLQYQHTEAHLDYPGARLTAKASNDRDEEIANLRLDYTPSETAQLFVKAYYHDWDTLYTTVNNSLTAPGQQVVVDDKTFWGFRDYGVNLLAKFRPHRGLEYHLGYDFQNYSGRDEVLLIAEQTEKVHAGILQVRTTEDLFEHARFAVGLRHNRTGESSVTVWNVSGRWNVSDSVYVEGVGGTSFVLPSAEQLFGIDPCCARGNPDLDPEESLNLNLTLGGQAGALDWQVTGFARRIDDLIAEDFSEALYPEGIYANTDGRVRIRGAELWASAQLAEGLTLQASYTYTRAREAGAGVQFARIPQHAAKASLTYVPADRPFGGSVSAIWTGDVAAPVTGFGRPNYGDYAVVDLSAHLFLDGEARRHKLGARLENALDADYATRMNSALVDNGGGARFLFRNRGVPRTLHVSYSYAF